MPNHMLYAVVPNEDADEWETFHWTDDYGIALELAQDAAEETGLSHVILQRILTIDPPESVPMHEYNGVVPGVDFPITL